MIISELVPNATFDVLKARILSKQGPKRVGSRAKGIRYLWELLLADQSGTTVLSLWGANAGDGFKVSDVITITEGWCKTFNGVKQVSLGRAGKLKKVPDDPSLPRQINY